MFELKTVIEILKLTLMRLLRNLNNLEASSTGQSIVEPVWPLIGYASDDNMSYLSFRHIELINMTPYMTSGFGS